MLGPIELVKACAIYILVLTFRAALTFERKFHEKALGLRYDDPLNLIKWRDRSFVLQVANLLSVSLVIVSSILPYSCYWMLFFFFFFPQPV